MRTPPRSTPKSLRLVPLVAALAAAGIPVHAATYTVTNGNATGAGSLQQAISDANSACTTQLPTPPASDQAPVINFSGPFTIGLSGALPTLSCGSSVPFSPTINGAGSVIDGITSTFGSGLSGLMYGGTMTVTNVTMLHWMYGAGISASTGGSPSGGLSVSNVTLQANNVGIQNNGGKLDVSGSTITVNTTRGISGGATSGTLSGNTISNNSSGGIDLFGGGLSISGSTFDANGGPGVRLNGSNTTVTGNTFTGNGEAAVKIEGGIGNKITQNSMYGNADGILLAYGGTNQDIGDPDSGPNDEQNYPEINSVTHLSGSTNVSFYFNSTPNSTFRLEFYENDSVGVSEGKTFIGFLNVTTDSGGYATVNTFTVSGLKDNISAIAINANNSTSQFWGAVAYEPTPAVTVSPTSVDFGNVPINTSVSRVITLDSVGDQPYEIYDIEFNDSPTCYGGPIAYGGLMFSTDCQTTSDEISYPAGTGCQITVTFAPTVLGAQSGFLCVYDTAPTAYQRSIPVAGNGVPPPTISITPSSYDFGGVAVGVTSPNQIFDIFNGSAFPVDYRVFIDPPFALASTNCPNPLAPASRCSMIVNFTPRTADSFMGFLALVPTSGTQASATLFGSGVFAPAFTVPRSIEFLYALGSDPTVQEIPITNRGNAPLQISSVTISGLGFSFDNGCTAAVAPGATCILRIRYSTADVGTTIGSLTINSNAPTRTVELVGITQVRPVPVLSISPSEMNYGSRAFGTTSPTQTVTIRNVGGAPAIISSISASPDFVVASNACPASLAPLTSCLVTVSMSATTYGRRSGFVTVASNEERSPQRVLVQGLSCRNSGYVLGRLAITSGCLP